MAICKTCGASFEGNFCSNCGAKKEESVQMFCTACGAPLVPDARFCGRCGYEIKTAPVESVVLTAPVMPVEEIPTVAPVAQVAVSPKLATPVVPVETAQPVVPVAQNPLSVQQKESAATESESKNEEEIFTDEILTAFGYTEEGIKPLQETGQAAVEEKAANKTQTSSSAKNFKSLWSGKQSFRIGAICATAALVLVIVLSTVLGGGSKEGTGGKGSFAKNVDVAEFYGTWVEIGTGNELVISQKGAVYTAFRGNGGSSSSYYDDVPYVEDGILYLGFSDEFEITLEGGVPVKIEETGNRFSGAFVPEAAATASGKIGERLVIDDLAEVTIHEVTGFFDLLDTKTYKPIESGGGLVCHDGMCFMGISFSVKNLSRETMSAGGSLEFIVDYDGYLFSSEDYTSYIRQGTYGKYATNSGGTVLSIPQLSEETFDIYIPVSEAIRDDENTPLTIKVKVLTEDFVGRAAATVGDSQQSTDVPENVESSNTPQTYYAKETRVILDGKRLPGEDTQDDLAKMRLTVDGDDILLSYFGKEYTGHRRSEGSQLIDWNTEPYLIEDASVMMTTLFEVSNSEDEFVGYALNFSLAYSAGTLVYEISFR